MPLVYLMGILAIVIIVQCSIAEWTKLAAPPRTTLRVATELMNIQDKDGLYLHV